MKTVALSLLLSSGCVAFSPANVGNSPSSSQSSSALHVSVVRDIITKRVASSISEKQQRSNEELLLEAFETLTPESVGMTGPGLVSPQQHAVEEDTKKPKRNRRRRKHNYREQSHLLEEEPDLDFFTLHSSAVSHLHKDMPVNDIVRAIKRAQNLHDAHDLATISSFLIDYCDEHWGFGYRGSLLSRLAVAALHCGKTEIAARAIETRRVFERPSMQPHESAAIVRGLMRVKRVQEGWEVLNDELRLPMEGVSLTTESSQELLKHRSRSLASIASRHFYEGEPYIAARALSELGALGKEIVQTDKPIVDLDVPWGKLVTAATVCGDIVNKNGWDVKHFDRSITLQSDLAELVWDAMFQFPCPGEEEECSLEDYIAATP